MPGYLGISQMSFLIKTVNAIVSWHQQDTLTRCENRNAENRWFILSIFIYTILKLIYQKAVGFLRLFSSLPYLINNMSDIYLPQGGAGPHQTLLQNSDNLLDAQWKIHETLIEWSPWVPIFNNIIRKNSFSVKIPVSECLENILNA